MKSKRMLFGMPLFAVIFSLAVIACDDDSGVTDPVTDPALNGTWVLGYIEITFNNGNWEDRMNSTPFAKGTYTTNNGEITTKSTHLWGNGGPYQLNLDAKWYTKAELQSLNIPNLESLMTDGYTRTYSINGNTLTFTDRNGNAAGTWTRK